MYKEEGSWNKFETEKYTLYYEKKLGKQYLDRHDDNAGYGGRTFELTLKNGKSVEIVGPFSSRPDFVRQSADINFVGYDEKELEDRIILYEPGSGNNWAIVYDYSKEEVCEYYYIEKNDIWAYDYGKTYKRRLK